MTLQPVSEQVEANKVAVVDRDVADLNAARGDWAVTELNGKGEAHFFGVEGDERMRPANLRGQEHLLEAEHLFIFMCDLLDGGQLECGTWLQLRLGGQLEHSHVIAN